jgi:hypothetical protein
LNLLNLRVGKLLGVALLAGIAASAQTPAPAPGSDVMVLVDGEKLVGLLESANDKGVTFKSNLAGEVKVAWSKINELQSSDKFAVAKKGQVFGNHSDPAGVPQGTLAVSGQKVTVTPAAGNPEVVAVADTENVIPQDTFLHAFQHPKWSDYWSGAAGLGFAWVQSTQKSETLTTSLNLQRTVPSEVWIDPRYRTTIGFNSAYGNTTDSGTTIKTNIIHAGLEQDQYFNRRLFGIGDVSFDHNYSQDLSLQYTIGLGLGFVAYKDAHQELDFKGQIAYISQNFGSIAATPTTAFIPSKTDNLVGAILGETYNRSLARGIALHQELDVIPTFNKPSDYTANFIANLGVPVGKKFNITFGVVDAYLNNPPSGFQKNSFQFVTNLTYKIN